MIFANRRENFLCSSRCFVCIMILGKRPMRFQMFGLCVFARKKCGNAHGITPFVFLFYWILAKYELARILLFLFYFFLFPVLIYKS